MGANVERILILKPSALGDVVTVLPALHSLRKQYPDAKISWFVNKGFAPLIENNPELDEVIIFDRKLLSAWWRKPYCFTELFRLMKRLKNSKFDLVIDFQGLFRSGFFSWVTRAKRIIGMSTAREGATLFYKEKVSPPTDSDHVIAYYRKLVEAAGVKDSSVEFHLKASDAAAENIRALINGSGADADNYAVIVPGASTEMKCWPAERFADAVKWLSIEQGYTIVGVGSGGEAAVVDRIAEISGVEICNLAGKTDLSNLVAVMQGAKAVLSNDTGPGHIAFATGVPTVLVFGLSNPRRCGLYQREDAIACVGYEHRGRDYFSKEDSHRIENVSVEMVISKIKGQLGQ